MAASGTSDKLQFFTTDFCPFAQRTWIALLEKEPNPRAPVNFELKLVSLLNKPAELLAVNPAGEVPAGVHRGKCVFESLQMNEYVDETFSADRPLLPSTPAGKWDARVLISKHTPGVVFAFYAMMREGKVDAYLDSLEKFQKDIKGPYVLGDQFTLVDIAFWPFLERAVLAAPTYYPNFSISTERFAKLRSWYDLVSRRESVRITSADRSDASMGIYPYGPRDRAGYLRELYAVYAFDQLNYGKELLKNAPPGVTTVNIADLKMRKEADANQKKNKALADAMKLVSTGGSTSSCAANKCTTHSRRVLQFLAPLTLGVAIGLGAAYGVRKYKGK